MASRLAKLLGKTVRCTRISTYLGRNEVFTINDGLILKIFHIDPRQRRKTEMASLAFLERIGIPGPQYVAHSDEEDDLLWLLQTRLKGDPLSLQAGNPAYHANIYREIGGILARLQDASITEPPDLLHQTLAERWAHTRRRLDGKSVGGLDVVRRAIEYLDGADLADRRPLVFVHNDFSARNFLVDPGKDGAPLRFIGLIDFEKSFLGDPWADLAILLSKTMASNPVIFSAFCDGFGRDRALALVTHPNMVNRSLIEMLYIVSWAASDDPDFCASALAYTNSLLQGTAMAALQL
ncbi:aminoglycoside phosphotransferase family protein [Rhizobium jaguaris]|uniref:phosphotransferase family protein n=1 Tax=Rhizobium jaguaris TaxID=1312183 RepID=UPI0013C44CBF|nr:aminoglycoside phosphotransferase family protein [Rhizobium jaguaris]